MGRRKNRRKKLKIGQKLHEIKKIMADFGKSKNIFLNSLEKNWKIGNNPPSYNYGSESK